MKITTLFLAVLGLLLFPAVTPAQDEIVECIGCKYTIGTPAGIHNDVVGLIVVTPAPGSDPDGTCWLWILEPDECTVGPCYGGMTVTYTLGNNQTMDWAVIRLSPPQGWQYIGLVGTPPPPLQVFSGTATLNATCGSTAYFDIRRERKIGGVATKILMGFVPIYCGACNVTLGV